MSSSGKNKVAMGRLGRAKGLNGDLFLSLFNPESEFVFELTSVEVGASEEETVTMNIESIRDASSRLLVSFDGVNTRDQAEKLTNQIVYVDKEVLPELPAGTFYHFDLVGFDVFDDKAKKLGVLTQILTTLSNEIYVVQGDEEIYLPNIPGVIQEISEKERKIVVCPPEYVHAV